MRLRLVIMLGAVILFALPGLAAAQNREPHAGTLAIGADAGVYVPGPDFHAGFSPDAFLEYYLTGRFSLRGMVAVARPKADNGIDELRQFQGTLNLVVNWEADYWHPFVTIGAGGYGVQARSGGVDVGNIQALAGCNVGAGVEYFARPKITFKFEATYHYVQQGSLFASPSGLAASVGVKRYF